MAICIRADGPGSQYPCRENGHTPTKTASGAHYYGFRFYNPTLGRWLNRDPIEEQGGVNLYEMVLNDPANAFDPLGEKRLKDYIAGGVTSSADKLAHVFDQLSAFGNNHPASITAINLVLAQAKRAARGFVDQNEKSMGWGDLGAVWLFEIGKDSWKYGQDDNTTNDLKNEDGVEEVRKLAKEDLRNGCIKTKEEKTWKYGQPEFYKGISSADLATSFTGSYYVVADIDCGKCQIAFTVSNTTGWASGTRLRKAATPGGIHQPVIPDRQRGDGGIALGGNISQEWKWTEDSKK